jgi:hypothetical protein
MSDNPRPSAVSSPPEFWVKPIRLFVELISIFAIFSFIASTIINETIFTRWHLSFFQLATPEDVILSGLQFAFQSLPLVIAFSLVCYIYYLGLFNSWLWSSLGAGGSIIGISFLEIYFRKTPSVECGLLDSLFDALNAVFILFLLFSVLPVQRMIFSRKFVTSQISNRKLILTRRVTIVFLLLVALSYEIHRQTSVIQEYGYAGSHLEALSTKISGQQCKARVMWVGSKATILKCLALDSGDKEDVLVLLTPQSFCTQVTATPKN